MELQALDLHEIKGVNFLKRDWCQIETYDGRRFLVDPITAYRTLKALSPIEFTEAHLSDVRFATENISYFDSFLRVITLKVPELTA